MRDPLARHRAGVVGLLVSLFALTYLDRVCISVAGPRMQADLHISPVGWGWVTGIFTLSYCFFEIPSGVLGDRIGPRKVLTRIVLWWSAFTALTGAMSSFSLLLVTRFLFGAGEAGAFPNVSIVIARWFRPEKRATMVGVILMASQIGGAIAPLLVIPIQMRFGWRASFYAFGGLGLIWAAAWYWRFRDSPAEMLGLQRKAAESVVVPPLAGHRLPWRTAFRSPSVLAILGASFCCIYVYNFFQTWFHTFLVKGRGFSETGLLLTALPFAVAACASLGGWVSERRAGAQAGVQKWTADGGFGSAGGSGGVYSRGDVDAAASADHSISIAGVRRDCIAAVGMFWRVPRHWGRMRRRDGWADEYSIAAGRAGGRGRVWVSGGALWQL